jgi:uncharacterized protein (DUF305 family)
MRLRLLPAVPLLLLGLAGCGNAAPADVGIASAAKGTATPSASASATSTASAADRQEAGLKFAQCMREHGVDMEDPGAEGGIRIRTKNGDGGKTEKAMQACQHFMKDVVGDKGGPMDAAARDKMVKFAQCMRQHGIDMPDPGADGAFKVRVKKGEEAQMDKAQTACKEYAPGFGKKP